MSSPVEVVAPGMPLKQAMDRMVAKGISSVFVAEPPAAGLETNAYGILTERDVMRRIAAQGEAAFAIPVGEVSQKPVKTIRENAFVYRAIGRMSRLKFRHLGVTDDNGWLIGVVSARDLLRLRIGPAIALDDSIEIARNASDLAIAWSSLPQVVNSLVSEDVEGWQICRIISEEIRAMTRRAAELARQSMAGDGHGAPPCEYAVMVLGSGGRGESMLAPDQDNALVFAAGEPGSNTDDWFREFATRMSDILDKAGIPLCKGGVMAKNEQWRGSRLVWRERIRQWVGKSRPQDLLNVDIFFDEVPVDGNLSLGQELFREAYELGHQEVGFAKMLGENLPAPPSPFSWFGRLKGNSLDLKMHALFPIAATARALSIRHNLPVRSTRERLDALIGKGLGGEADLANLKEVHARALAIVLESQATEIAEGRKPSNIVDPARMPKRRLDELAGTLRAVEILPTLTRDLMFATGAR
jgi:DNA polymerase-3 subunit epsilon/CBS domain-containing protein